MNYNTHQHQINRTNQHQHLHSIINPTSIQCPINISQPQLNHLISQPNHLSQPQLTQHPPHHHHHLLIKPQPFHHQLNQPQQNHLFHHQLNHHQFNQNHQQLHQPHQNHQQLHQLNQNHPFFFHPPINLHNQHTIQRISQPPIHNQNIFNSKLLPHYPLSHQLGHQLGHQHQLINRPSPPTNTPPITTLSISTPSISTPSHLLKPSPTGTQHLPFQPLPSPASSTSPSRNLTPGSRNNVSNVLKRKIKVRLPLEHTPDRHLALDESRIRSRWTRVPLKISFQQLFSHFPIDHPHWHHFMSCIDLSDHPFNHNLPSSIDVYLPGRDLWDDLRMEMLEDRLNELGYPTKISLQNNSTINPQQMDSLDEHEQDLRQRLDLRKRLQAFQEDNLELDLQIPPIHGVFPIPNPAQPSNSTLAPAPSSPSPPSNSQLHPPSTDSSKPIPDSTQNPTLPSLKPTAPEFKPSINVHPPATSTTQLVSSPLWDPPYNIPTLSFPSNSLNSDPHSLASSQTNFNPPLNLIPEVNLDDNDDDLLTDSDEGSPHPQSNPPLLHFDHQSDLNRTPTLADCNSIDTLRVREEQEEEEADMPLASLQKTLQSSRQPLPRSFISVNHPDNTDLHYDGDVDRRSDCTNPSDEEDCLGDEQDNPMAFSQIDSPHHQSSPLSTPQNRMGRSHTFGISSYSGVSMSAGQGQPHNWINGSENEEGDLISNPSDEEEAELYQLHRTILKSTYSEIATSINKPPGGSAFKSSTPTSRLLLSSAPSPEQATNLAITLGRATGSVMSLGMLENFSSNGSLMPHQGSASSLNAFAPEFKPTVIFSSPLIPNSRNSKDSVGSQTFGPNNISSGSEKSSKPSAPICSIGRGAKRPGTSQEFKPKASHDDNLTKDECEHNPDGIDSIILFEQPVSSAPFQVPPSFPTLSTLESTSATTPSSPSRKIALQEFEQPGKDNMRTFKFPASPQSRMILYQAQMSRSFSPAVPAPVREIEPHDNFRGSVDSEEPISNEVSNWSSTPLTSAQHGYPSLVVDIPSSPALAQIDSGLSVSLRQRSSFEDDSGSDLSRSASRPTMSGKLESSSFYELIPTQPRSNSWYTKQKEQEEEDEEEEQGSPNSVVSLYQLQEQKKQWRQLTAADGSRSVNSYHSGSDTHPRAEADRERGHPGHSVPLMLDLDARGKSGSEAPQVVVPPGSPFSPFDGIAESSGSMYSFNREEPPMLNLPPPTSHLILPHPVPRMLSLKPSHNNLAQNFRAEDSHKSLPHLPDHEELDGLPEISIRNRGFNLSPSSPSVRWPASSEEGNSKGSIMPTREISKTDVEDETLFSSRILEEKDDEDSSSDSSSSDSSISIETNSKRHQSEKRHVPHGLMADLESLLTRKLKGLRQDLGELHSLKVDWDSLKRDAIIEEITSLMDNILHSWSEPWKEKIAASIIPDQKADTILAAIHQWGGKTEDILMRAINKFPHVAPDATSKDPAIDAEAIRKIRSELENLTAQLDANNQLLDLDSMTSKLSEAVKPQIVQLIDLASDKSETANLISKQLKPYLVEFQTELESMLKRSFTVVFEQNEKQTSIDGLGRAEFLAQLDRRFIAFQTDSQQRLSKMIDDQTTAAILAEIKEGTDSGFDMIKQLDAKTSKLYEDLSNQANKVSEQIIEKLELEVERGISRRQDTENMLDQLRVKNSELELNVAKARSEHGKIRSERAVERERNEEDRSRLIHERDRLQELVANLQAEQLTQNREKVDIEIEKNRLAGSLEEMRQSIEQLNVILNSYKTQETQWQHMKVEQQEKIANLKLQNQMCESQIQTIKTEMELKQKFFETREMEKETELIRLKEKDLDQSNQIKKLIEDQIPLIKNFDLEIRDLIKLKSESDGEIRTLRKRISDQDEQIGNLHQSSASKQQALAMAKQKLSELERRGKQENEGFKAEIEQLKLELHKVRVESEVQNKLIQDEKVELENQVNRLRSEVEMGSVKEAVMCQNLSIELDQSNQRRLELEDELKSFKDLNELLKNQIEDLRRFHENQKNEIENHHNHYQSDSQNSNGMMMMGQPQFQLQDQSIDWNLKSQQGRFNQHGHELSLSIEEDEHQIREFVSSTIPLSESIHAPSEAKYNEKEGLMINNSNNKQSIHENTRHQDNQRGNQEPHFSNRMSRRVSNSSIGTVKSFKGNTTTHPPLPPPHIRFSSNFVFPPNEHHPSRFGSPTPSRISISSKSVSMDHDGWWSSTD